MVRTPKNVVVRAKDDPIGDLIVVAKKVNKVFWDENEWDRLADMVWKMKATSTDGLARIASLAQKQFPQNRQRPGVLTVGSLQPLVKRIRAMEEETREKAERADQLAAQVTFFQGVPKTKQEIISSLTDDEIRENFFGRFLAMLTVDDIVSTFSGEQLIGSLGTGDLAAIVARRLVEQFESPRPIEVRLPSSPASNGQPKVNRVVPTVKQKRIVVIGYRGDEATNVGNRVKELCSISFMDARQLRPENVPKSADLVILWTRYVSHKQRIMVLEVLGSSKVFQHHFGVKELVRKIEAICGNNKVSV